MRLGMWQGRLHDILLMAMLAAPPAWMGAQEMSSVSLAPAKMAKLGTVDQRYLSYNVEMVEVTGGRFWKPYKAIGQAPGLVTPPDANHQVGVDPNLFQYRPPIDLSNPRLRKLAKELGPAYVRVSGTWANSTYFQDDDRPALKQPPQGFNGVLTRAEWKGVADFARAVGAEIVTSVAVSPGARGADGVWAPAQAKAIFDYTKSIGSSIAATEFMNEPTFAAVGGAPKGYDAAAYGKDVKAFAAFLREESPKTIFLGPGSIGEGISMVPAGMAMPFIHTEDMLKATGPVFDAFSYHFYGTVSRRCTGAMGASMGLGITADRVLSAEWLDRTDTVEAFYAALRDKYLPGKPMWLTETAEAACGGDEFAGQFIDAFRFLNQLGTLAQKGVKTVMHNTLASSDYGLLNEDTLEPTPDYWAAVLWKRTMGPVVLDAGTRKDAPLRIYAQCMQGKRGGVAIVALNTDAHAGAAVEIPVSGKRYTLTGPELASTTVLLNGAELKAGSDGSLPKMEGESVKAGTVQLPPASVTFLTLPSAANAGCR